MENSVGHIPDSRRILALIFFVAPINATADTLDNISNAIRSDPSLQGQDIRTEFPGGRTEPVLTCNGTTGIQLPVGQKLIGRLNVKITCDTPAWSQWQPVLVRRFAPVLVSSETLRRGTDLNGARTQPRIMEVTWMNAGFFTDPAQIEGARILRDIPAGSVILPGVLGPRLLVKRGEQVIVETGNDSLTVKDSGIAENDASQGGTVRVRHARSGRIIEGVATAPGVVRIPF